MSGKVEKRIGESKIGNAVGGKVFNFIEKFDRGVRKVFGRFKSRKSLKRDQKM